jgi:hypothetical protein
LIAQQTGSLSSFNPHAMIDFSRFNPIKISFSLEDVISHYSTTALNWDKEKSFPEEREREQRVA